MFPEQIVNEELKYAAILDDCLRAMLEMKTAFVYLYKDMSMYLSYRSQNQLLKEQCEIESMFGRLINACSKT